MGTQILLVPLVLGILLPGPVQFKVKKEGVVHINQLNAGCLSVTGIR